MEQANWRGMPYYGVLWRKKHLTLRELRGAYASSYTYIFWFFILGMLIALDFHGFAERVSFTALVVYTLSLAFVTSSLYVLVTIVGVKISKKRAGFFIIYPIVGLFLMTAATYLIEAGMSSTFGGGLSFERALEKLPANLILNLAVETLFMTFVMPFASGSLSDRTEDRMLTPAPEDSRATPVVVSGRKFEAAELMYVSAQDHYIVVKTAAGQDIFRARLSDLVEQLSGVDGIQPHRSHWVARNAVSRLVTVEGQKRLEIIDNSFIPVARGRIASVQEWLES